MLKFLKSLVGDTFGFIRDLAVALIHLPGDLEVLGHESLFLALLYLASVLILLLAVYLAVGFTYIYLVKPLLIYLGLL